jgi:YcaO-like protein with predicted kinase domain
MHDQLPATDDRERKRFTAGTHRTRPPAETVARLQPHLRRLGITRVADVTGLDRTGIPVVMVVRPNSRSVAVSQGKGLTLDAAKASGLMESIETWHAERIVRPMVLGSWNDLAARHRLVAGLPSIEGSRWHPDLAMLWIEGRELASGEAAWLPYEMVHSNYTVPRPAGHGCFPSSTNGLASGNSFLEAACHAICEVIERDATTLWHRLPAGRRAATAVDLASIDDADCRLTLAMFAAAELAVSVWETTTDVAVPCFFCLVTEEGAEHGHMGAGAGCHPSRGIALLRALTEAAQTRTTYIAGSRDDLRPEEYAPEGIAEKYRFARRVRSLEAPGRSFADAPGWEADSFAADLSRLLAQLAAVGCDPVVGVDLSSPELADDVAVARVAIPGLEAPHDDVDYLPGPRARAAEDHMR